MCINLLESPYENGTSLEKTNVALGKVIWLYLNKIIKCSSHVEDTNTQLECYIHLLSLSSN